MPVKPKRPCRYPGCPGFAEEGEQYCEKHRKFMEKHYEHFARGYSADRRYGYKWKKIRDRYVKKHPLCEECLRHGRYVKAEQVHHIVPLSEGGSSEEYNLMSLCRSCHEKVHQKTKSRQGR